MTSSKSSEKKQRILVLEDEAYRVKWLRLNFPEVDVTWTGEVEVFLEEAAKGEWDFYIMDHDLGQDENGYMAAHALPVRDILQHVIIWSINHAGSCNMQANLRGKGYVCIRIPFMDLEHMRHVISSLLVAKQKP